MPTKPLSDLEALVGDSRKTVEGFQIEAGKVAEFARAITNLNPVFHSSTAATVLGYREIPAPLTYTRVGTFPRYTPADVDGLGFDLGFRDEYILHGEHAYEYDRPAVVGDILTGTTTLTDLYERDGDQAGTMTFAVLETEYRDQHDERVLTERATVIETGGAVDSEPTTDEPVDSPTDSRDYGDDGDDGETAVSNGNTTDHQRTRPKPLRPVNQAQRVESIDELEINETGPSVVVEGINRQDFVRYAGASGDFNPIHFDEPYARAAGNETVFGQGMFTAGIASRVVTDWFGVDTLESFGVRFQSQLRPGRTVRATGTVTEIDRADGRVDVALEAATHHEETLLTGTATATLSTDN
ncbi:FAS1-like dehydratase domain-containing protein [Halostagnicola larsenii]|uniref:FAS1-like dehydratase domain-containing protein n=1 Tax=Halostagnicola larsenii TaxID=353800 RepID=UPI000678CF68|nr:MaoC family dehydratase N-terminal domain-containing protein [Halostagnicola larsenii]